MLLYGDLYRNKEIRLRIANNGYSSQKLFVKQKNSSKLGRLKNIK